MTLGDTKLERIVTFSILSLAFLAGVFGFSYLVKDHLKQVNRVTPIIEGVYETLAGKDRIISPQETRIFLEFLGYRKPINEGLEINVSMSDRQNALINLYTLSRGNQANINPYDFLLVPYEKLEEYNSRFGENENQQTNN